MMLGAWRLEGVYPLKGFQFFNLPRWFTMFTCAQLAIQIGMMYPLSAVYFKKFPAAGVLANYIAIPLIGLIVQFGLIAGLLDTFFSAIGLTGIGTFLALLINAFNWLLCKGFLGMASFFSEHIPYPHVSTPSSYQMILRSAS